MAVQNPIDKAPRNFDAIVGCTLATISMYRSGKLDPQYYGNYSGTIAAVADTFRKAAKLIEELK